MNIHRFTGPEMASGDRLRALVNIRDERNKICIYKNSEVIVAEMCEDDEVNVYNPETRKRFVCKLEAFELLPTKTEDE
ncbi:MAG TPA: hypothetical protein VEY71_11355 [Chitinophagales bacterium]|nr:hypothetical protein [Chitinophagales bacterium]